MEFEHPPVQEALIATEFAPVPGLDVRHLVAVQTLWSNDYPALEEHPAIPPPGVPPVPLFSFGGMRFWSLSEDRERVVQVQNDRLIVNWRAVPQNNGYPRFPALLEEFRHRWKQLTTYLTANSLPLPEAQTIEFTYVNEIAPDLPPVGVLAFLTPWPDSMPGSEAPLTVHLEREVEDGRLAIDAVFNATDLPWNLSISTRLSPEGSEPLDTAVRAHEISHSTFKAITRDTAKQHWGLKGETR